MDYTLSIFSNVIKTLLSSKNENEEVISAKELEITYTKLLKELNDVPSYSNKTPTALSGGIALSSQHALDCLKDPLRTVRFIKSMYAAINDAIQLNPNTTLEILYAGCGPVAPIILPLLHLFNPEQLQITLLDITPTSKQNVENLISLLKATPYFKKFMLCDAITYQHPKDYPLHIIVSEVMDKALTREPQVRVTQNLAPQLHPNGIFIPERISIFQEFSFYGNEPYFDIYKNVLTLGNTYKTIGKTLLFDITKDINTDANFSFNTETIVIPEDFKDHPDVCIFAEVVIYKNYRLLKSKSLLSNPISVYSLYNLKGKTFQLHYTTHKNPTWKFIEV
ncbi:hypothetical protein ULMS_10050 [Patiriisocius marinistellae]|uniref:Phytanoyl-CoA dioxygenase n=1 Tax=Patiriisocius marinistellae TaxID=2494560 RepID=A0A5J4FT09_9FLAO|nr:hypothetical protein [Patiriisocius marinistellae]GEQ85497.1 hypothetical protein ULMS_10050 [Patiriisocius marinistellae]